MTWKPTGHLVVHQQPDAVAVVGSLQPGLGQEQVRYQCLRKLFVLTGAGATEQAGGSLRIVATEP